MQRQALEACVERLVQDVSDSGAISRTTLARKTNELLRNEAPPAQVDVQAAVEHLSKLSPAPAAFAAQFRALQKALPAEVGNFALLLSSLSRNADTAARLRSPPSSQAAENTSHSSNPLHRRPSGSQHGAPHGQAAAPSGGAPDQHVPFSLPPRGSGGGAAGPDPSAGTPRMSMAQRLRQQPSTGGLDLDSPLTAGLSTGGAAPPVATPVQPLEYPNPLYLEAARDTPETVRRDPPYKPKLQAEGARGAPGGAAAPRVTLPDAGNLFAPMRAVVADSAPEALQARSMEGDMPAWDRERPFLVGDHLLHAARKARLEPPKEPLFGKSDVQQELLLLDDLLYVFLGHEGQYVAIREALGPGGHPHFVYSLSVPCSHYLQEQLNRTLPIAEAVVLLRRFVESRLAFEFGTVCHAFAASVRDVLDDWALMVAQLEHQLLGGKLTLQALWFYCQPALNVLELTAGLCADASRRRLTGCALLDLLHAKTTRLAGDAVACGLVQRFLHAATVPYFVILKKWISEGVLEDRYDEFMVVEDAGVELESEASGQAGYWTSRHTLRQRAAADGGREEDVPGFLRAHAHYVLAAGKYLNVLRESGRAAPSDAAAAPALDFDPSGRYLHAVQAYYRRASAALLDMMRHDFGLVARLNSIKHFFFLDQGDFLNNFLDAASDELHKIAHQASQPRLRSLLELAIRTSSLNGDPHHERVRLVLDPTYFNTLHADAFGLPPKHVHKEVNPLMSREISDEAAAGNRELMAVELLMLSFKVEWPLNLVVAPGMMRKYQFIFKHLIQLRYVERNLSQTWQQLQKTRQLRLNPAAEADAAAVSTLRRAHSLCHRLTFFVQQYLRFMTVEVIEPTWHEMVVAIGAAASLDEVIAAHAECLRRVLQGCLLAHVKTLAAIASISIAARAFCGLVSNAFLTPPAAPRAAHDRGQSEASSGSGSAGASRGVDIPEAVRLVSRDPLFQAHLAELEDAFQESHAALIHLLKVQKHGILSSADAAAAGDTSEEADLIGNFINQISFRAPRRGSR